MFYHRFINKIIFLRLYLQKRESNFFNRGFIWLIRRHLYPGLLTRNRRRWRPLCLRRPKLFGSVAIKNLFIRVASASILSWQPRCWNQLLRGSVVDSTWIHLFWKEFLLTSIWLELFGIEIQFRYSYLLMFGRWLHTLSVSLN